jgi:hypothetical protein
MKKRRGLLRAARGDNSQMMPGTSSIKPTGKEDKVETTSRRLGIDPSERAGVDFKYNDVNAAVGIPSTVGGTRSGLALGVVLLTVCLLILSTQTITVPVAILGSVMLLAIILISILIYKMKT